MKKVNEQDMNVQLIANFPVESSFIYATRKGKESGTDAVVQGSHTVNDGIRIIHTLINQVFKGEYTLLEKAIYLNTVRQLTLSSLSMTLNGEDNGDVKFVSMVTEAHQALIQGLLEEEENMKILYESPVHFFIEAGRKVQEDIQNGLRESLEELAKNGLEEHD